MAHAGTFRVGACTGAPGNVNNSWLAFDEDTTDLQTNASCRDGRNRVVGGPRSDTSGLSAADVLGRAPTAPAKVAAGWTFVAPVGTTITAATLVRDLYKANDNLWHLFVSDQSGEEVPAQDCTIDPSLVYQCEVSGTLDLAGLRATSLSIGLFCAVGCVSGLSDHNVRADLDSAIVTLSAPTPPTAPTASGLLTQLAWHSGTAALGVSSTDPVGISQVQVRRADSTVLATATLTCDYTYPVPCRQASAVPLPIDTNLLPDGADTLTLVATDAAQNTATSPITVLIGNHPPPPPRLSGAPAGRTRQLSAAITAQLAAGGVPITAVHWMLCGPTGCGAGTAVPVPPGAPSVTFKVTVPRDGDYAVVAYATDAAGHRSLTATEPFDVDRSLPAPDGVGAPRPGARSPAPGVLSVLPAGPSANLRLPRALGRNGLQLRLTLRRRPHHRVELVVRSVPARPGRVRVGMAVVGHPARIDRLTLHRGVCSLAVPVPAGPTTLTLKLAGLGARATDRVLLAPASPPS